MARFHFDSSGEAYDACQCDDALAGAGHTLVIPRESVVGLSGCWPIAVTVLQGQFHDLSPDYVAEHGVEDATGASSADIFAAVHEAQRWGWAIDPMFADYTTK